MPLVFLFCCSSSLSTHCLLCVGLSNEFARWKVKVCKMGEVPLCEQAQITESEPREEAASVTLYHLPTPRKQPNLTFPTELCEMSKVTADFSPF